MFVKLFQGILDSSVWGEDSDVRIVWITLLAMADEKGDIHASVPGLARRAVVSVETVERALARFMSPDAYSRTPTDDGRRLVPMQGGWHLVNYEMYRSLRDKAARSEYQKQWDKAKRPTGSDKSDTVPTGSDNLRQVPTDPDTIRQIPTNPTKEEEEAEADREAEEEAKKAAAAADAAMRRGYFGKGRPLAGFLRLKVFDWMVTDLIDTLGDQCERFGPLDAWLQELEGRPGVLPHKQWPWLREVTVAEAMRRGCVMAGGKDKAADILAQLEG